MAPWRHESKNLEKGERTGSIKNYDEIMLNLLLHVSANQNVDRKLVANRSRKNGFVNHKSQSDLKNIL